LEQVLIDPKAFICMHRVQRPVLDEGSGTYIDPWPDPGTIHTDSDIYFEALALLEGEQEFILPSADSEQAVTPQNLYLFIFDPHAVATRHPRTRLKKSLMRAQSPSDAMLHSDLHA
jgi:hypothetical protein